MKQSVFLLSLIAVLNAASLYKAGPDLPSHSKTERVKTSFFYERPPSRALHTFVEGQGPRYPQPLEGYFYDMALRQSFEGSYAPSEAIQNFEMDLVTHSFSLGKNKKRQ